MNLLLCFVVMACFVFFPSGPSWPAEVALQHQPAAAEPSSADEGGRWRGRQGQTAYSVIHCADYTLSIVFVLTLSYKTLVHSKPEQKPMILTHFLF